MRHDGFDQAAVIAGHGDGGVVARIDERLTWVTEAGEARIGERRRIAAAAWPAEQAWGIAFETTLANITAAPVVFAARPLRAGRTPGTAACSGAARARSPADG